MMTTTDARVPAFLPLVQNFTLPQRASEVADFIAARRRESKAATDRESKERDEVVARLASMATKYPPFHAGSSAAAPRPHSKPRPAASPGLRLAPMPTPKAHAEPSTAKRRTATSAEIYTALNAPRGICGDCGGAQPGPAHGCVSDNIKAAAPRARSLSDLARAAYGFMGGGSGPGLIQTSTRGGGR